MNRTYRHYGDDLFRSELLPKDSNSICTRGFKPCNCMWSSPVDSRLDWYSWCMEEEFNIELLVRFFDFKLKTDARIYIVNNVEDLRLLIERFPGQEIDENTSWLYKPFDSEAPELTNYINFQSMYDYYDGLEVNISSNYSLYYWMYGYDVDSLVVWNPDVVEPL